MTAARAHAGCAQHLPLVLTTAFGQRSAKDEDRLAAARLSRLVAGREAHLLVVADGHGGRSAAQCAAQQAAPTLEALLQPLSRRSAAVQDSAVLAARLQEALVFTVLELQRQFAAQGCASGCSLLLALVAGDLLTVASLGSSRCTLDLGTGSPLDLAADHRISCNPCERERLRAGGYRVALVPPGAVPPPHGAAAGDGVLRLWPGGLALARSIGAFPVGEAVLPLPHVKQLVLPPSGGRLVLATRPVWAALGRKLHLALRGEPLHSVAQVALRGVGASTASDVDASVLIADVLPRGETWQGVCARLDMERPGGHASSHSSGGRGSGKGLLRLLGFGRQRGGHAAEQPAAAAGALAQTAAPKAELLADYDTAALLGLAPPSAGSLSRSRSSSSLSSTSSLGSEGGEGFDWAEARQPPLWFTPQAEGHMRALLAHPHLLWAEARLRRQYGIRMVSEPAGEPGAVPPSWLSAAAAAVALEGDLPPTPSSTASSPATQPGPAIFAPSPRPPRPSQPRSSLLAAAAAAARAGVAEAAGAAGGAGASSAALATQPSLSRMSSRRSELGRIDEEREHEHAAAAQLLRRPSSAPIAAAVAAVLAAEAAVQQQQQQQEQQQQQQPTYAWSSLSATPDGDVVLGSSGAASPASVDTLGTPRRRLPPLRTRTQSEPALLPSGLKQPAASAAPVDEQQAWLAALESKAGHFMRGGRRRR